MLTLTADNKGKSGKGWFISPGKKFEYLGHVPGGMVKIRLPDGTEDIAHPGCFKELK